MADDTSKEINHRIPSLDGIRTVAFCIVFFAHAGFGEHIPGGFGVTVFFFLSGYLITTLLRKEYDTAGAINLKQFYIRRCLRILPPFYLVLGITSALTLHGVLDGSVNLRAAAAWFTHLSNYYIIYHGYTGMPYGAGVCWSLAVEEHFYILFPIAYLLLRRRFQSQPSQMLVLMTGCVIVLAWRCLLVFGLHEGADRTFLATDTRLDSILFGCILAVIGNPVLDAKSISESLLKRFWLPVGIAAIVISFGIRAPQFQNTFRYTLQGLGLFPIFIVAIRYPNWGLLRLLNLRWIRFVGVLSYSLYLVHHTVIFLLEQRTNLQPVARGLLAFAISTLLSTAIYFGIERPCARLRKRLSPAKGTADLPLRKNDSTVCVAANSRL